MDIERLYCDDVLAKPINYSFDPGKYDHEDSGTGWKIVYPDVENWKARELLVWAKDKGYEPDDDPATMDREQLLNALPHEDREEAAAEAVESLRERVLDWYDEADEDSGPVEKWHRWAEDTMREDDGYAPVLNYLYPISDLKDPAAAQTTLDRACVPVVVVLVDDEPFLALSGGGMDLSWEICQAYIELGHMPPLHFCDLPKYSDRGKSERDQLIIRACLRSCETAHVWAERRERNLKALLPAETDQPVVER
jgi:hypothetical protein